MEELITMLTDALCDKMSEGIECVDTNEAGMVCDMIKDLSEAYYHMTVVEAMKEGKSIPYISSTAQKSMI